MKKKIVSLLLVATMAVGVLSGCGNGKTSVDQTGAEGNNEKVEMTDAKDVDGTTISFWHSMGGVNGQAIDTLVQKFNAENEYGITVDAQYQGEYDDSLNKLKSAQIGNMGADLVQVYEIGTRFMIESGWVVPMQEMVDADQYDVSQIESNLAAYYTIDNELYSMPFNSSTPIMYYNKDMFAQAGITEVPDSLEGIDKIGDQLLNNSDATEVMSLGIYGWFFEQFVGKQGLDYADNGNGRDDVATAVDFDKNGAAKNILTEWQKLNQDGYAPIVGKGGDAGLADFSAGKSAITLGSTASLKQILQDVNGKFEVGTAYFPKVKESDEGGVSIGGASLWALNNQDPKKLRATWEFVKFLISPESQAFWNAQTGYFPVTTAAHEEQTFKDNIAQYPQFQTAIDQLHEYAKKTGLCVNIELKTGIYWYPEIEEKTLELVKKAGMEDRVIYSSFNHYSIQRMKKIAPQAETAYLYSDVILQVEQYAKETGVDGLHPAVYHVKMAEFLKEYLQSGLKVRVWTVNREEDMEELIRAGVTAVITNYPDVAGKVKEESEKASC